MTDVLMEKVSVEYKNLRYFIKSCAHFKHTRIKALKAKQNATNSIITIYNNYI